MKTPKLTAIPLLASAFAVHAHPGHEPGAADVLAWSSGGLWALAGVGLVVLGSRLFRRRNSERIDG